MSQKRFERALSFWMVFACALLAPAILLADEKDNWGDLKMQIILDGQVPKLDPPNIDKDVAVCAAPGKKPVNEDWVVSKLDEVRDVWLVMLPEKEAKLPMHPSYIEALKKPAVLDNQVCRFSPHILTLVVGQTLQLKNSDTVGHNSNIGFISNSGINKSIPGKDLIEIEAKEITKPEKNPVTVSCGSHNWMKAKLLVTDHPYVAVSDDKGQIEMKNIPVGKYMFQLRHDSGYVIAKSDTITWGKQGKAPIEIKPGVNNYKVQKMPPK